MDQFAQAELEGRDVPEALEVVRVHLEQCKCCRDEYNALLTALREIEA
jgi:predicted anti-sigma-YlaC factor YlaD